jgi:hypothetical protein
LSHENALIVTGPTRPVNQRTSKLLNWLARFQPRELHKHSLRGAQLDSPFLRQALEQLHQAWHCSGLARFGPTTPTRARGLFDASVDPTEAACVEQTDGRRRTTKTTGPP